ncbi:MAG: aldehyde ferredoxin oxidoreductase, partial [Candidatus Lokiarchaeota archaeon]|nr:aldehyde ferredoxin oxidoreductase [Candidatus Lokiarchaeota archaeon]
VLDGDNVIIKSAETLWGKNTEESMDFLKEKEGKTIHSLLIGPAGENLVNYAAIMNDASRAFGRGGVGSVMGSKNLKAIVVKNGKKKTEIHNSERLKNLTQSARDKIKVVPITRSALPRFGTSGLVNIINELGMFPINNFQKGYDERAENLSGESIRNELLQKDEGCFACPIRCGRLTKAGNMEGKGPEYESVWALGANLGIYDLTIVAQANYLCNKMGLDTISCGGTIACAMELQQNGLLKSEMLKFGNKENLKEIIIKIAKREDIGDELAEGAKQLAEKYQSPETAIHVKGMELPAYDPRGAMGHALGYATSNRGGDHLTGYLAAMEIFAAPKKINRFNVGGKSDLLVLKQNSKVIEDSMGVCAFAGWALGLDFYARFLTAITNVDYSVASLIQRGNKIYNMERLFSIKAGMKKEQDTLPKRFLDEPLKEGFSKDKVVPIERMLEEYYNVRKWDENGIPKSSLLKDLEINIENYE